MIETGITVEGVPLENHLEDKKRKRFFESIENEIREKRDCIYHRSKTKCRQRHDTRPSKVRHILKEKNLMKPKSAGEAILLILNLPDGGWWTIQNICVHNSKYGKRAYAQAMVRLIERFPFLILKRKADGLTNEYLLQSGIEFADNDLLKLYRKEVSLTDFQKGYPDINLDTPKPIEASDSFSKLLKEIDDLQNKFNDLEYHLAKTQLRVSKLEDRNKILDNSIKPEYCHDKIEVAKDSGVNINVYLVDPREH